MGILVIMNHAAQNLMFVRLNEEDVLKLENEYDNNIEAWVSDTELEEKLQFNMSNCNYMYVEEMPEMYGYDMKDKQEVRLSLFS